jgi:hypothetical protein
VTSGAVDLANIDATTNANKANGARLTAAFFNRLSAYGKELKRQVPRQNRAVRRRSAAAFDCRTANDPAMMQSTRWNEQRFNMQREH